MNYEHLFTGIFLVFFIILVIHGFNVAKHFAENDLE